MAFGVGVGLVAVAFIAWRFSERRQHRSEMQREVQTELVRFATGVASCSAGAQLLPDTSERVPARLADVAGKAYTNQHGDYHGRAYVCAGFSARSPQRLQYRWVKDGALYGRAEARGDADGDGVPDTWYEIRVDCSSAGCEAPNFPHEVLSDGRRLPPSLLGLFGRARATQGEPPSLSADDTPQGAASSRATAPPKAPLIEPNVALAFDTLFIEAERRAGEKLPGATLLEIEIEGALGPVADPKLGASLSALYGVADAAGIVAPAAEVLRVEFDARGLTDRLEKATRRLARVGFTECLPGKLIGSLPAAAARRMTLAFDRTRERAVWRVQEESAPQRSYGAENCALLR